MWPRSLALLLVASTALADRPPPEPLEARARDVCDGLQPSAKGFDGIFHADFLAKVPAPQLAAISEDLVAKLGRCTDARIAKRTSDVIAELELVMEKGWRAPATLVITPEPPHLVTGLLIKPPLKDTKDWNEVAAELKKLHGKVSALVVPLDGGKPLLAIDDERPMAVGSAFKLYVLAEIARQGRKLDDVLTLKDTHRALPSGILHTWPSGAPVTLHTAATLMISISDNTASDLLIDTLGRDAIEKGLGAAGHQHPEGMRPFLTTAEMFRLKLVAKEETRVRYGKAKEAERRKILASLTAPLSTARLESFNRPTHIDTIEWFASAGDLCRVMDVLRKTRTLRETLSVNVPGSTDEQKWQFRGFKGGSEPGVLNMTFLLEGTRGAYCVAATWNDPEKSLEEVIFAGLVQSMIRELEK
jgi:beta-lactamase class A